MDNINVFDNESIWIFQQMLETLYTVSPDGKSVIPWLATSYDLSPDQLTYTFHLRPGVKFHNGQPMTSADVKFSLDTARDPNTGWGYIDAAIKSVSAPDPMTVVVKTKYKWAPLIADIALFNNAVLPKDYAGESQKAFYTHPIGTGPFKWDHWTHGKEIELVKNPDYWQPGKPHLDSVTWTTVPDDATRELQLKGGQAQIDEFPPFSTIDTLKATPGITMTPVPVDPHRLPADEREGQAVRRRPRPPGDLLRDRPAGDHRLDPVRLRRAGELVHAAAGAVLRPELPGPAVRRGQGQGGARAVVGAERVLVRALRRLR